MAFETRATITTFGGKLLKLTHQSAATGTPMNVNLYLPPAAVSGGAKVPVLIYLSGLTCTPENCSEKGFFQAAAARRGIAVVYPDTSPRGLGLPGETESWDFGAGAGFYVDATREPWRPHYRMETYVASELPAALFAAFAAQLDGSRVSITGHSMGGHGALTLYLKHPGQYRSVSAFAPIANPSRCPWGEKAFAGYLGDDRDAWKRHDATELVKGWQGGDLRALVDVGTGDNFYKQGQLLPENFEKAVKEAGVQGLTLRYQPDYDHSYYFMSTFAQDHVDHAAKYLFE
ncbi:putative esterase [Durotheca rogersii]|uniref:putative esterase n=1 Tax=Durotheca rogersii TaxID=419775 RepID=UPI00221EB1CE|nr:putative esterase [Durotheca rogersii]KAI5864504.1 putative esterase [Durotheca rogersii]